MEIDVHSNSVLNAVANVRKREEGGLGKAQYRQKQTGGQFLPILRGRLLWTIL